MNTLLTGSVLTVAIAVLGASTPLAAISTHAASVAEENQLNRENRKNGDLENNGKSPVHTTNSNDTSVAQNSNVTTAQTEEEKSNKVASKEVVEQPRVNSHNPAGNNGFIKVNSEDTPDSIPNNDPHVPCEFKVEFYNYDKNSDYRAKVNFALHSPTKGDGYSLQVNGNTNPFIGEDAAGGGNDLDAVETYRLSFTGDAHPKQGYHVKLTINADGSRGSDVKHKVFWVEPCKTNSAASPVTPAEKGKTLSTTDVKKVAVTPTSLPSTGGASLMTLLSGLMITLGTYGFMVRRSLAKANQ